MCCTRNKSFLLEINEMPHFIPIFGSLFFIPLSEKCVLKKCKGLDFSYFWGVFSQDRETFLVGKQCSKCIFLSPSTTSFIESLCMWEKTHISTADTSNNEILRSRQLTQTKIVNFGVNCPFRACTKGHKNVLKHSDTGSMTLTILLIAAWHFPCSVWGLWSDTADQVHIHHLLFW